MEKQTRSYDHLYSKEEVINCFKNLDTLGEDECYKKLKRELVTQLRQRLKSKNYDYEGYGDVNNNRNVIESSFIGENFYVNSFSCGKVKLENVTCYDNNWCYAGVFLSNVFPLSNRLLPETNSQCKKTECFIVECEITIKDMQEIKRVYDNFYYNLYSNYLLPTGLSSLELFSRRRIRKARRGQAVYKENYYYNEQTHSIRLFLTNIDYEIFTKLYNVAEKLKVINRYYYQDVGYLPEEVKEFVYHFYTIKKELKKEASQSVFNQRVYKLFKTVLEAITYGKNAESFTKETNFKEGIKNFGKRSQFTSVASFQVAYARKVEADLFFKHHTSCLYMNGDSFITNDPSFTALDNAIGDKPGEWKREFKNLTVFFNTRNSYVVYDQTNSNKKKAIVKITISGLTKKQGLSDYEELELTDNRDLLEFELSELNYFRAEVIKGEGKEFTIEKRFKNWLEIREDRDTLFLKDLETFTNLMKKCKTSEEALHALDVMIKENSNWDPHFIFGRDEVREFSDNLYIVKNSFLFNPLFITHDIAGVNEAMKKANEEEVRSFNAQMDTWEKTYGLKGDEPENSGKKTACKKVAKKKAYKKAVKHCCKKASPVKKCKPHRSEYDYKKISENLKHMSK